LRTEEYILSLEKRVGETLSKIQGVGDVYVMITLQSGAEKILATDEKSSTTSTEQTQRDSKVTVVDNEPLVVTELVPQIEGIVIAADGAADVRIKEQIHQAVMALLGVKSHKIAVFPKGI